jgi:hypothetical protein
MNSGITGLSRAGHGKLSPIPPEDIDSDVTYDIALEFERGLDWSNLPAAKEVRTTISVKPFFDERYLPDGAYQLRTEKATWQMNRRGNVGVIRGQPAQHHRYKIAVRLSSRSRSPEHLQPLMSVSDFWAGGIASYLLWDGKGH